MHWSADQLVRLAKRESNSIRPYLFVNPLQGKHIPASPGDVTAMCRQAAGLINAAFPRDRLFVIGFAETATGIAASISSFLDNAVFYQNTTRESDGSEALLFSEAHSHATDQLLRTAGMEEALRSVGRVVFIDDEVTTGNTICNLIRMIRDVFRADHLEFTVLSILNSMSAARLEELRSQGIECFYLCRLPFEYEKESIMGVSFDPERHIRAAAAGGACPVFTVPCPVNPRFTTGLREYLEAVRLSVEESRKCLPDNGLPVESALVVGTEEFMYPTVAFGEMLLQRNYAAAVRIHSTTRSPILASGRDNYPLFSRVQLRSPYDPDRTTYIYNLTKYDRVFILTDANPASEGTGDLRGALESAGNGNISVIRWQYDRNKETV